MVKKMKTRSEKKPTSDKAKVTKKRNVRKDTPTLIDTMLGEYGDITSQISIIIYRMNYEYKNNPSMTLFRRVLKDIRGSQQRISDFRVSLLLLRNTLWREKLIMKANNLDEVVVDLWDKAFDMIDQLEDNDDE